MKDIIKYIKNKELKEHKNLIIGFFIVILGGILLILQLMGTLSSNAETTIDQNDASHKVLLFASQIFNILINKDFINFGVAIVLADIIIIWQLINIKKHVKTMGIFYTSLLWEALIYVFIYKYRNETMLTLYFIMLFCIWIDNIEINNKKLVYILNSLLAVISLFSFGRTIQYIKYDINYNYSSSREVANYINTNIGTDAIIIAETDYAGSAVIPYCGDYLFYSPEREDFFNYIKWDSTRKQTLDDKQFRDILNNLDNNNQDIYLLYTREKLVDTVINMIKNKELIEVYRTGYSINADEMYFLYKLNI